MPLSSSTSVSYTLTCDGVGCSNEAVGVPNPPADWTIVNTYAADKPSAQANSRLLCAACSPKLAALFR